MECSTAANHLTTHFLLPVILQHLYLLLIFHLRLHYSSMIVVTSMSARAGRAGRAGEGGVLPAEKGAGEEEAGP